MGGIIYAFLLISGSFATALSIGLAALHWALHKRPCLDAGGWIRTTYGLAALATCSIIDRDIVPYTVMLVASALFAAFITGRRTCGPLLLVTRLDDDDTP